MTDDLVKRLRGIDRTDIYLYETMNDAADRIEALTAERDAWEEQHAAEALGLHVQMQRADAFEAKLANLVEKSDAMLDAFCILETQRQVEAYDSMCATLAEIDKLVDTVNL